MPLRFPLRVGSLRKRAADSPLRLRPAPSAAPAPGAGASALAVGGLGLGAGLQKGKDAEQQVEAAQLFSQVA